MFKREADSGKFSLDQLKESHPKIFANYRTMVQKYTDTIDTFSFAKTCRPRSGRPVPEPTARRLFAARFPCPGRASRLGAGARG
jgi:hypothetical protein